MVAQTINPPDLDDLLAESRETLLSNINCIQIGKISKINNDQTCEIEIQFLRRLADGTTKKYTPLVDCPYFVLNGGSSYIDMPISKGDYCLVLFNDRNIDDWWDTGNVAVPADTRKHDFSDGIALVGINPRDKALSFDSSSLRIIGPGSTPASIVLKSDGTIEMTGDTSITGKLTVSDLIRGAKDIIADYLSTAISLLNHFHLGNLGYNTDKPVVGSGTPKPVNAPTGDSSGNIDMKGNDLLNIKDSVGGQTNHSAHGHQQPNDFGGDAEAKTSGPS